jgi:hypothetical protein
MQMEKNKAQKLAIINDDNTTTIVISVKIKEKNMHLCIFIGCLFVWEKLCKSEKSG